MAAALNQILCGGDLMLLENSEILLIIEERWEVGCGELISCGEEQV